MARDTTPFEVFLEAQRRVLETFDGDDVLGCGIGNRIRGRRRTDNLCLNVYVRRKRRRVARSKKLPRWISVSGRRVGLDVQTWKPWETQAAGEAIDDGIRQGCLGGYFRRGDDTVAFTAAHCLRGPDGRTATPDPVQVFDREVEDWRLLGYTGRSVYESGTPTVDRGILDYGEVVVAEASQLSGIEVSVWRPSDVEPLTGLVGQTFTSYSYLVRRRHGVVHNVHYRESRLRGGSVIDVVLASPGGLSRTGDSGKVWVDARGRAVALHFAGTQASGHTLSRKGYGCFLFNALGAGSETVFVARGSLPE